MATNRGATSLRVRHRREDPMREFDRLPAELRAWLSEAALPWRPRSVRKAFDKAVARTRNTDRALAELTELEQRLIAKDARQIWGGAHPDACPEPVRAG